MYDLWRSNASSLLEVFQAVRGRGYSDGFLLNQRQPSFSQRWPSVLARLTGVEAAMLQDFRWWGTRMEDQLKRLSTEESESQSGC